MLGKGEHKTSLKPGWALPSGGSQSSEKKQETHTQQWGPQAVTMGTPLKTFYRAYLAPDNVLIESCILTQLIFTGTL